MKRTVKTANYMVTPEQILQATRTTLAAIVTGYYTADGKKVYFPDRGYDKCAYVTNGELKLCEGADAYPLSITISPMDAFEALSLTENPERAAVLNFACGTVPGGGFLTGHKAQEECLCRMSTLYASLESAAAAPYYSANIKCTQKLRAPALLYSPEVYVFRNPDLSYKPAPVRTQVVSMAAPNLRGKAAGVSKSALRRYFAESIAMMCRCMSGKADTLILGAWGCGAFGNDPQMIAGCFREILVHQRMGTAFRQIIFAIRNSNTDNYAAFCREFADMADIITAKDSGKDEGSMGRMFPKGSSAFVVEKCACDAEDGDKHQWHRYAVTVKSSGKKYVTAGGHGPAQRFLASDKPALKSVKGSAYLVSDSAQADTLITMLSESVTNSESES